MSDVASREVTAAPITLALDWCQSRYMQADVHLLTGLTWIEQK